VPIDPRLTQLGFKPVARPLGEKRRLFITLEGPPASGKTHFLRTCRPPIVVINFDRGLQGVAEYDIWGGEIAQFTLDLPDLDEFSKTASTLERGIALKSYSEFKRLVDATLKSGAVGTLAIETGTAAYTLAQVARFGQIAQLGEVPAALWTSMQGEFERIFLQYEDYPVNLVMTHRQGSKFGAPKGEMELKGYKQMQYLAQVHLAFDKRYRRKDNGVVERSAAGIEQFDLVRKVVKCRQRLALEGAEFPVVFLDGDGNVSDAPTAQSMGGDFLTIAQAIFPDSVESDWL
jgi:hypothetical protein